MGEDLLDQMTFRGTAGRRRASALRGLASGTPAPTSADCVVVAEDASSPGSGQRIVRLQDLVPRDSFDGSFEEKGYRMQLQEFAYRGERIAKHAGEKLGQVQRMVRHDGLRQSQALPRLLWGANDELHRAYLCICGELEAVWHLQFEPFFYPSEPAAGGAPRDGDSSCDLEGSASGRDDAGPSAAEATPAMTLPGGWLDLDDMFLTAHTLLRCVAELVGLIDAVVRDLPAEALASRQSIRSKPVHPAWRELVSALRARAPWVGVKLAADSGAASRVGSATTLPTTGASAPLPLLKQAIIALDSVIAVHIARIFSDASSHTARAATATPMAAQA